MGFMKKTAVCLLSLLALSALPGSPKVCAAAAGDIPAYTHGTIAAIGSDEGDVIVMDAGGTAEITISPYVHVQYKGCGRAGCPDICGGYDCFEVGKGCKCEGTDDSLGVTETASVTARSVDEDVAAVDAAVRPGGFDAQTVGSQAPGTLTLTARREGETEVTVTASLRDWIPVEKVFTVRVGAGGGPQEEPPVLDPQRTKVVMNGSGRVTFPWEGESYDPAWAGAVSAIYVDGQDVTAAGDHRVDETGLTLPTRVFTKAKRADYDIRVTAAGYSDLNIRVTVNSYGAQRFTVRLLDTSGRVIRSKTYTREQMIQMADQEKVYQTVCGMRGITSYKARGIYMEDLLRDAGISFGPGMRAKLRTNDAAVTGNDPEGEDAYYDRGEFTYEGLIGTERYVFPDIYTDDALKGQLLAAAKFDRAMKTALGGSPKEEIAPMFAYAYTESIWREEPDDDLASSEYGDHVTDERAFKFLFGIAMDPQEPGKIADEVTTWSAAYGVFGVDIIGSATSPAVHTPGAVQIKTAVSKDYKSIRLTWSRADNATGYRIYRAASKNGKYQMIGQVNGAGTLSYIDKKSLVTGKIYHYKVQAIRRTGADTLQGKISGIKSAKPLPEKAKLTAGKRTRAGKVVIQWKKVPGASGYIITRASSKNGRYKIIKTLRSAKSAAYTDAKASKGKAYYYKVQAYRTVGGKKVKGAASNARKVEKLKR